jgi:hypothetical protein
MDVVDSIEESLLNLDSTFEKEGLVPMDAYRLKALLENLTKNQVVLTLENLASGDNFQGSIHLTDFYRSNCTLWNDFESSLCERGERSRMNRPMILSLSCWMLLQKAYPVI